MTKTDQNVSGDMEPAVICADNDAASIETSQMPSNQDTAKATDAPLTSLPTDVTGKTDTEHRESAERRNLCPVEAVRDTNHQTLQPENYKAVADGEREPRGQEDADVNSSHSDGSICPDRINQGHPQKKTNCPGMISRGRRTPVDKRKDGSHSAHRHTDDTTGNKTTCKTSSERRKKHASKQTNGFSNHQAANKSAGRKPWSKDVLKDTGKKNTPGGHQRYANSQHRNAPTRKVYDPLIGRHNIPVCNCMNLMEHIVADQNFLTALRKVNSEPNKAAGYDRRKVREVCGPLLASPELREEVRRALLDGTYNPAPVRTVLIPKKNGKMRVLGIGTVLDRIVQTMILQAVPGFLPENPWSPFSFAYQAGLGVSNAIAEVNNIREEGYSFCITLDLSAFFDNVPHDRLLGKLKVHLKDPRVIELVKKFLTSVIAGPNGELKRNRIGTPQGSVLSPWLASTVAHRGTSGISI